MESLESTCILDQKFWDIVKVGQIKFRQAIGPQ